MTFIIGRAISGAGTSINKKERLKRMLKKGIGMEPTKEMSAFIDMFVERLSQFHPKTIEREFYFDYITPLENNICVDGTTVHIIYALKMVKKYEKRHLRHFQNTDIRRFDMQHEAWMFEKQWTKPILDAIDECMGR